ncbi:MAG: glycosyltransferase [Proteobacteria bacterium]|nr:glycosyltransferase [Pseudomonadota bacterium]MBU1234393.1 glycosyltransferase [Pseudomonadota bacterium]MBU1418577.1 glycosyltransferase [Pseudomonadota bacterium]MBU1455054.1 glycosyltransferase [Pseudomonadota bacterium]
MHRSISLIIPTDKVDTPFQQCLESIGKCAPPPLEIIIVVDGDTGQVLPHVEGIDLKTIRLPVCGGPGRARNAGVAEASGDILLFVDADVLLPEDICLSVGRAFSVTPSPDAVFGSYDDKPPAQNTVSQYKNLLHHYTHQHSRSEAFTFWTGCGAILRRRFIELKGFNEEYLKPSIEDIELGYRLKQAGGTILLDKTIKVTHLKTWSLFSMLHTDFFLRAIPWSRLIYQYGTMHNDMNINRKSRLSVVLCCLTLLCFSFILVNALFLPAAFLFFLSFLAVNRDIFLFFYKKKGLFFFLKTIPLHFLYSFLSSLAFCVVSFQYLVKKMAGTVKKGIFA